MTGIKPAQFQQAAVDHIVQRLRDKSGSRRMLLADEVGLASANKLLSHSSLRLGILFLSVNGGWRES